MNNNLGRQTKHRNTFKCRETTWICKQNRTCIVQTILKHCQDRTWKARLPERSPCPLCVLSSDAGQTGWPDKAEGRDVKKSTTALDFMDYWRLLRPAGGGIILVSLLNWMRVSGTGAPRVKVIGLTSEYHVCNPLVWYLRAAVYLGADDKLPAFRWPYASWRRLPSPRPGVGRRNKAEVQTSAGEKHTRRATWVAAFTFITILCLRNGSSTVICMAERNKWSMFFKAVERECLIVRGG